MPESSMQSGTRTSLDFDRAAAVAHKCAVSISTCRQPGETIADLKQELLLLVLQRWGRFDPARGDGHAFAAVCMARQACSIARSRSARQRCLRRHFADLRIAASDPIRSQELQSDLHGALAALPLPLRQVCMRFLEDSADGTTRRRRPSLGRARAQLRKRLEATGLREYLT